MAQGPLRAGSTLWVRTDEASRRRRYRALASGTSQVVGDFASGAKGGKCEKTRQLNYEHTTKILSDCLSERVRRGSDRFFRQHWLAPIMGCGHANRRNLLRALFDRLHAPGRS